jgi:asparagine synthase (glutamine-hydrolysing)
LARRYLPAELIQRPKQGFSSGLPYMLSDEFRLLFRTFLTGSHLASAGYLRQGPIQSWLEEHLARRVDHGNRLWLLCNAEVWYRMAIDGWSPEEIRGQMTAGPPIAAQKV